MKLIVIYDDRLLAQRLFNYFVKKNISCDIFPSISKGLLKALNKNNKYDYLVYISTNSRLNFLENRGVNYINKLQNLLESTEKNKIKSVFVFSNYINKSKKYEIEKFLNKFKKYNCNFSSVIISSEISDLSDISKNQNYFIKVSKNNLCIDKKTYYSPIYFKDLVSEISNSLFSLKRVGEILNISSKRYTYNFIRKEIVDKKYVVKPREMDLVEISEKLIDKNKILKSKIGTHLSISYKLALNKQKLFPKTLINYYLFDIVFFLQNIFKNLILFLITTFILLPILLLIFKSSLIILVNSSSNKNMNIYTKIQDFQAVPTNLYITNIFKIYELIFTKELFLGNLIKVSEYISVFENYQIQSSKPQKILYKYIRCSVNDECSDDKREIINQIYLEIKKNYENNSLVLANLKILKAIRPDNLWINKIIQQHESEIINNYNLMTLLENKEELFGLNEPVYYLIGTIDQNKLSSYGGEIEYLYLIKFEEGKLYFIEKFNINDLFENLKGRVELLNIEDFTHNLNSVSFEGTSNQIIWLFENSKRSQKINGLITISNNNFNSVLHYIEQGKFNDKNISLLYMNLLKDFKNHNSNIYLVNKNLLKSLENMKLIYSYNKHVCSECKDDFVFLSENTTFGNYKDIQRKVNLSVNIEEKVVKKELYYILSNNSNEVYKYRITLTVPNITGFSEVNKYLNEKTVKIKSIQKSDDSFKSIVVDTEIPIGKTEALIYSWEMSLKLSDRYQFSFYPQINFPKSPFTININNFKDFSKYSLTPSFVLTDKGDYQYNTQLLDNNIFQLELRKNENN